ncbi:MAG: UDP-N-acetylmuramate dehydrogenase [Acidimicrobiia bacterium]
MSGLVDRGVLVADLPLGPLTTYKSGGPARWYADITDRATLDELIASGITTSHHLLVLGRGSNLVISDQGFDGLVIRLGAGFTGIATAGVTVSAGGAIPLPRLARASVEAGIAGLEFFVGVPGSVGGAVRQNAGCFGTETKDRLVRAEIVDLATGATRDGTPDTLDLGYRHSNLFASDLVVGAVFAGSPGDPAPGSEEMKKITRWRRDHQPGGTLNAGSVFKNPPGEPAGALIDRLGLKGTRVGDVAVSEKHANFFVAGPEATSEDILRLVDKVKDAVFEMTGTKLETEIQFVGFDR